MDYRKNKRPARCEDCEFYDYDEETDSYTCNLSLDQDELESFIAGIRQDCPYFRYYDEYKSTHNQI